MNLKALLSNRKSRERVKRLILKGRIVISMTKILKMIEEIEIATKNKKKGIDKSCGRLRKNVSKEFIMILEETKDEEDISGDDSDDEVVNVELA